MTSGVLDFGNRRRWDEFTGQHDSGVFLFAFDVVSGFSGDSLATTNVCIAMEFLQSGLGEEMTSGQQVSYLCFGLSHSALFCFSMRL